MIGVPLKTRELLVRDPGFDPLRRAIAKLAKKVRA